MAEGKDNHAVTIATLGAKVEALASDVSEIKTLANVANG